MPAMAIPMSRCEMSVSVTTAPCCEGRGCHGRAAASRAALTAATTSMTAANMSRIQAGVITRPFRSLRGLR